MFDIEANDNGVYHNDILFPSFQQSYSVFQIIVALAQDDCSKAMIYNSISLEESQLGEKLPQN